VQLVATQCPTGAPPASAHHVGVQLSPIEYGDPDMKCYKFLSHAQGDLNAPYMHRPGEEYVNFSFKAPCGSAFLDIEDATDSTCWWTPMAFTAHDSRVHAILLIGVALNWLGAAKLFMETLLAVRSATDSTSLAEHLQFKLFAAGTAAVFGSLYLYLYIHPVFVIPFLAFGAALKTWALLLSLYLFLIGRMTRRTLFEFGVSNGIVGTLFWIYLLRAG
jgi:hypothetical protein